LEGKEFLFGFMQNEINSEGKLASLILSFSITSPYDNNEITVIDNYNRTQELYTLNRGETELINANNNLEATEASRVRSKSIRVVSKFPVLVYCYNHLTQSMDSYAVLPLDQWGNEYAAFSMPIDSYENLIPPDDPDPNPFYSINRHGQVLIIANENQTVVRYNSPVNLDDGTVAGRTSQIILNQNETFVIEPASGARGTNDITGLNIFADKPIGVISGHERSATNYAGYSRSTSKDHLAEMLLPKKLWKTEYFTVPFALGTSPLLPKTHYKVIADVNTEIIARHNGTDNLTNLAAGNSITFDRYHKPVIWQADNPISIMQVMVRDEDNMSNDLHDPAFLNALLSVPTSNYLYFYQPWIPNTMQYHYLGIVCSNNAIATLRYNDELIQDTYDLYPLDALHSYVVIESDSGLNTLICDEGFFSANAYGVASQASYAHNLTGADGSIEFNTSEIVEEYEEECFEFEVNFNSTEEGEPVNIAWVDINEETLDNVEYVLEYEPFGLNVKLSGKLINTSTDGTIELEIVNELGKRYTWSTTLQGQRIRTTEEFDFGEYNIGSIDCRLDMITNNNPYPIEIVEVDLPNPERITTSPEDLVGRILEPNETIYVSYCLVDSSLAVDDLIDSVSYDFGCLTVTKQIRGSVQAPGAKLIVSAFPKIRVADQLCDEIEIVNDGNIQNTLLGLEFEDTDDFFIDTLGLFPMILDAESTLSIPICYTPSARGNHQITINVIDSIGLELVDSIMGIAGEPTFESYTFNFGMVRTGRALSHQFQMENIGDYEGDLVYVGTDIPILESQFESSSLPVDHPIVSEGNSLDFNVQAIPNRPGPYTQNYYFVVDPEYNDIWYHDTVVFSFQCEGIEPEIESYVYDLGEFIVNDEYSEYVDLFALKGNDSIIINSLNILDINDINADAVLSYTGTIIPESVINELVSFQPSTSGLQEMKIELVSDAGYGRTERRDTTIITATANPIPSISAEVNIDTEEIISCVEGNYSLDIVVNPGTFIGEMTLEGCEDIVIVDWNPRISQGFESVPIAVKAKSNDRCEGIISFPATFDTIVSGRVITIDTVLSVSFDVEPTLPTVDIEYKTILLNNEDQYPKIGSDVAIGYSIDFSHDFGLFSEEIIVLRLEYDFINLKLKGNSTAINVGGQVIEVPHREEGGSVVFEIPAGLIIDSGADDIYFDQTYTVLLGIDLVTPISLDFDISDCFNPELSTYTLKIDPVCAYSLRTLRFFDNLSAIDFNYRRDSKTIEVNSIANVDHIADLNIIDITGKMVQSEQLYISEGESVINITLDGLSNGVYIVTYNSYSNTLSRKISITN
jgi:hypothetical protein